MATKALTISNFTWGIWNDKYLSVPNWFYDWEWLDIRRGKRVILSTHNQNNIVTLPYWDSITYLSKSIYANSDWYIYNNTWSCLYKFYNNVARSDIRNMIDFTISWTLYKLIFWPSYISRYTWTPTTTVWLSRPATWWDWLNSWSQMIKTAWSTTAITASCTIVGSSYYRLEVVTSHITAWNITVTLWGAWSTVISTNWSTLIRVTASTTAWLVITPSNDFNWWVEFTTSVWLWVIEEWWLQMTWCYWSIMPLLEDTWDLYIWNENKLWMLDNAWVLDTKITLPIGNIIVAITKVDDQFILWTKDDQWWRVYYWDWVSEAPTRVIYWYNEKIQQVINQWNYHIVMTWWDFGIKKIWISNGNNKENVFEIKEWSWLYQTSNTLVPPLPLYWGWSSDNIYTNNVETLWDMVFIPWYNKIIAYWKRIPWFPNAFNCDFALKQTKITAMYAYEWELRVAYDDDKVITYKLDNYESMQDATTSYYFGNRWYMSLTPIAQLISQEKNWVSLKLWYKTPTNTFMNIYYAINKEVDRYTFVIDETVNPVTTDPTVWAVYDNNSSSGRFTVTKVTKFLSYMFIEVQETVRYETPRLWFVLNKISWTGDSAITYVDFHNYRYFDYVSETNSNPWRSRDRLFNESFFEIQFRIEFITRDGKYTPELNDFTLLYDDINGW